MGIDPKYPDVHVKLTNTDSNIFFMMGRCTNAMRRSGVSQGEIDLFVNEVTGSSSHDAAIQVLMRWVDVS